MTDHWVDLDEAWIAMDEARNLFPRGRRTPFLDSFAKTEGAGKESGLINGGNLNIDVLKIK